jgi:predicted nucleic acid-binding protein
MIVVDTNVLAYLAIEGEKTALADQAYCQDSDWVVPNLWSSEFLNVLALYLRKNLITLDKALLILGRAYEFISTEYQVYGPHILELVLSSKCSAYDCEFVALAKELNVKLLTEDKQILEQFPEQAVSLKDYVNFL